MDRIIMTSLILMVLFAVQPVFAGETVTVGEVVVTATRYEEELDSVPAYVTVITEEDISNSSAQNIPDLLRTEAGVHVNDIAGNRRNVAVDLRGFGETSALNTLVLVDGRRVNQADLSGTDWAQISLDQVQRIEIIRGSRGSVLYGDNASGGVINIITKEGGRFAADAGFSTGSYGTFRSNASVEGKGKNLTYALTGSYHSSDGYRDNSDSRRKDAGVNLGYYVSDTLRLGLSAGYHSDDAGLPGALKESDFDAGLSRRDTAFPDDYAETEDYYIKGGPEIYFWEESYIKFDASFRKREFQTFASFAGGSFTGDTEIETVSLSPRLVLKNNAGSVKNTLLAGIDYEDAEESILNDSLFFGSRTIGEFELRKENRGYYVHDEVEIAEGLLLSGGYRYDRADFSFDPSTPDSATIDEDLFTVAVNYRFHNRSYAYLSYAKGFRYPVLDEMFSFFTNTIDTGLIPQRSDDYEVGVRHYFTDIAYAQVNLFRIDTENEIFFNPGTYTNENLDGVSRRDGIEVSFQANPLRWLMFNGSYTYMDATIRAGTFEGEDLPNVPRYKSTLGVVLFPLQNLIVSLSSSYIGERPFISDFNGDFGDQESYMVVNGKIKYRWHNFTAYVDANNLFNEEYSEYGVLGGFPLEKAFYPSPERNFLVGMSVGF
jgi:iron complex outermembrane receptor protein